MADILEEAKMIAGDQDVKFPSNMHIATAVCHQDSFEKHTKFNGPHANTYRTRYTNIYWAVFWDVGFLGLSKAFLLLNKKGHMRGLQN